MEPSTSISNQPSANLENKTDDFYCALCDVKNNNMGNFKSHIISKKHLKKLKVVDEFVNAPKPPIQENTISNFDVGEDDMDDTKYCKVCLKHLPNEDGARAHYRSKKHKHKQSIVEKTWNSQCLACNKSFTCEQQWKQHMASAKHVKQVERADVGFSLDMDGDELEMTIAEKVLTDFSCELCAKRFSGSKPIQDHLKSKEHSKNLKMAQKLKSDLAELERRKNGVALEEEANRALKRLFDDDDEDEIEIAGKKTKTETD